MNEHSEGECIIPAKKRKLCIDDNGTQYYHSEEICNAYDKNSELISDTAEAVNEDVVIPLSPPKSPLPPCKYGANCYRKNILHFAQYGHPTRLQETELEKVDELFSQDGDSDADADTDIELEDETQSEMQGMEVNECMETKNGRLDTVFMRGPSIMRSYSLLNEEQRRDLIRRAFELKEELQRELSETQQILFNKNKELEILRSKIEHGHLLLPGEQEAQNGTALVHIPLYPEREYKEGSAAQIHFRLAESQFYRLLDVRSSFRVIKVEFVVSPQLLKRFQRTRARLRKSRGESRSLPVLGFHGTNECNIHQICLEGFKLPGDAGFEHATDTGHYGRGVYFSEYPSYSMSYIRGARKLLLCQVLPGRIYKCDQVIHGQPLQPGFDSHMSPDGKELVVFSSRHILPNYIVHYKESNGDFRYEIDE